MLDKRKTSFKNMNQFNFRSKPIKSLDLPQNIQIISLEVSENGQGGVIFIQLCQGSFIIKPSVSVPNQIFYNKMAIQLGLNVPSVNYFTIQDYLHTKLLKAINNYCKIVDQCLLVRLKNKFNFLFYAIIQYVPSVGFEHIGKQRLQNKFLSSQRLHQFGLCLGFDMIVNNHDRFQFIWSGDGNLGNVLIQVPDFSNYQLNYIKDRNNLTISLGRLVFIDNQGYMCNVKNQFVCKNIQFYIKKVINFFTQILNCLQNAEESLLKNSSIIKFVNQIELYTQYRLKQNQVKQIIFGIIDIFECFVCRHKMNKFNLILQQIKSFSNKMPTINLNWLEKLQNININYLDLVFQNIQPVLKEYYNKKINKKIKQQNLQSDSTVADNKSGQSLENF